MEQKLDFIQRARRLASWFIKASDEFTSLSAELKYRGWDKPIEEGGIDNAPFTGINADIDREDLLMFMSLVDGLLTPLTPEQRAVFYRMRAPSNVPTPPLF